MRRCRGYDTNAKVNPPLRTAADVAAIKEGLADGTLDAIACDHAPHTSLEKDLEFEAAAFGLIGLETSLGLSLKLVHDGVLSLSQLVAAMSTNPARILGVPGGTLAVGSPADVTLMDLNREWTVDANTFASKSRNCPFNGWTLKGKAVMTIVGGKVVWEESRDQGSEVRSVGRRCPPYMVTMVGRVFWAGKVSNLAEVLGFSPSPLRGERAGVRGGECPVSAPGPCGSA